MTSYTSTLEPGSREWYIDLIDHGIEMPHSRSWYAADGSVDLSIDDRNRLEIRQGHLMQVERPLAIPALGYMLDYSGARPNLLVAKQTGARVISRYISPPIASTAWKRIGTAERDQILKIIGDLWFNWEWYAGRMLEGAPAGAEDGRWALKAVEDLSYPRGRIIPASHDTGTINDPATLAYCGAFNKALDGSFKMTVYGSYHTTTSHAGRNGVQRVPWQTKAWSGSNKDPNAAVFQNTNQWFNGTVDENEIWHTPFGTWAKPYPKPAPPPPPAVEDVLDEIVTAYPTKAAFQADMYAMLTNALSTMLWGDARGINAGQMNLFDHGRASLGIYDAMSFFTRGRLIKFSKDPKAPSAVYAWDGGDKLVWINSAELAVLQRVASPDPKGKTYNYALQSVVDMPITGQIYKLQVADGTDDPRKVTVEPALLDYDEHPVVPFQEEVDADTGDLSEGVDFSDEEIVDEEV